MHDVKAAEIATTHAVLAGHRREPGAQRVVPRYVNVALPAQPASPFTKDSRCQEARRLQVLAWGAAQFSGFANSG